MRQTTSKSRAKKCHSKMGRREFTKSVGAAAELCLLPKGLMGAGTHIEYIRKSIPPVSVPTYGGRHYSDRVPDTLDLAERARLADPVADYECWFTLQVNRKPMVMSHDWSD